LKKTLLVLLSILLAVALAAATINHKSRANAAASAPASLATLEVAAKRASAVAPVIPETIEGVAAQGPSDVYRNFSYMTIKDRKAVYRMLNGTTKAALWTIQFELYKLDHPELAPEKAQLIDQWLLAIRGQDLDAQKAEVLAKTRDAGLKDRILEVFDKTEGSFFYNLGGPEPPPGQAKAFKVRNEDANCNCNHADDWCQVSQGTGHCNIGGCKESCPGCGTLWLECCNNRCSLL